MTVENHDEDDAPRRARGEDWTYEAWFKRMGRKPRFVSRLESRPRAPIERPSFLGP
jgi:hypothetical protein